MPDSLQPALPAEPARFGRRVGFVLPVETIRRAGEFWGILGNAVSLGFPTRFRRDDALTIESDFPDEVLRDLERRGHVLERVGHLEGPCAMQAIRLMPNGVCVAGSDTRRDGWACAY